MSTSGRLTKVYEQAECIGYDRNAKFIIMSDCHRGVGNVGDNFLKNRHIYTAALTYYCQRNFTYLELGDGDELWENKNMEDIIRVHSDVFELLSKFYKAGRLYMLYGNHDIQKRKERFLRKHCKRPEGHKLECRNFGEQKEFFPGLVVREGLILEDCETKRRIFLVHGHQGDLLNDTLWRVGRFLVRHIWRKLELLGMENPVSSGGSEKTKSKAEERLIKWANDNKQLMIAGHTHRPRFWNDAQNYYFNDGSCVQPYAVTGIELEDGMIRLVKWSIMTRADSTMYIGREVVDEAELSAFGKSGAASCM
ncbi:MAG: metallophosphoesterase family protein [Lachnospiraceae bacterium]|nr:metallophosphoesterase family protein [Lachnospiraceae bacterium]